MKFLTEPHLSQQPLRTLRKTSAPLRLDILPQSSKEWRRARQEFIPSLVYLFEPAGKTKGHLI